MEEEGEWVALTLSCITYCTLSYEAVAVLTDDANCTFNIQVESRVSFFRGRQIVSRHGSGSTVRAVPSVAFPHITCGVPSVAISDQPPDSVPVAG